MVEGWWRACVKENPSLTKNVQAKLALVVCCDSQAFMRVHTHTCTQHLHTYTHTHTHTHTCIYTHIHTHAHTCSAAWPSTCIQAIAYSSRLRCCPNCGATSGRGAVPNTCDLESVNVLEKVQPSCTDLFLRLQTTGHLCLPVDKIGLLRE